MGQTRDKILMCRPDYFTVDYVINPWMAGHESTLDVDLAKTQWRALRDTVAEFAEIAEIEPQPGLPDLVFTANAGAVYGNKAVASHFMPNERRPEEAHYKKWFRDNGFDLLDLDAVQRYFDIHYWKHSDRYDAKQVMQCFQSPQQQVFQFRTAAHRFRMIDDNTQPVFVPYRETGRKLIEELRNDATHDNPGRLRKLLRRLQRYTVSLYEKVYNEMLGSDVELLQDRYPVLINVSLYDEHLGFRIDLAGYHESESLIV